MPVSASRMRSEAVDQKRRFQRLEGPPLLHRTAVWQQMAAGKPDSLLTCAQDATVGRGVNARPGAWELLLLQENSLQVVTDGMLAGLLQDACSIQLISILCIRKDVDKESRSEWVVKENGRCCGQILSDIRWEMIDLVSRTAHGLLPEIAAIG